jgi:hypothetical protein
MSDANILTLLFVLAAGFAYLLPISIAMARQCKATAGIAVITIFLGWTFIGWVIALAWAASGAKKPTAQTA